MYPFILALPVIEKLDFIHKLVQRVRAGSADQQAT